MSEKRSRRVERQAHQPSPAVVVVVVSAAVPVVMRRGHRRIVRLEHVAEASRPLEFEAAVVQIVVARHGVEDLEDRRLAVAVDGVPRGPLRSVSCSKPDVMRPPQL